MGGSFNTSGEFQAGEKLKDNVQGAAGDSHYPYQIPAPARSPEKQQTSSIKQGAAIPKSAHPLFDFVERVHFKEEKKAVEPPKSCTIPAQAEIFPDQIMPNPLDNWYYRDPQGNMQGPFSAQNLVDWKDAGYFKDSLNLCRQGDSKIWTIAELSKYGGFAPPVQPASTHQANQYYMLQQQRQQQQQFMPNPSGFNQMQSNMNYFQNPLGNVPFYHPSIVAPQPISQFQAQPELYQFHQGMHPQGQQNQQHVGGRFLFCALVLLSNITHLFSYRKFLCESTLAEFFPSTARSSSTKSTTVTNAFIAFVATTTHTRCLPSFDRTFEDHAGFYHNTNYFERTWRGFTRKVRTKFHGSFCKPTAITKSPDSVKK